MKVLTVVGARPQFVKAFPVSSALRERHEEVLVHTGQHYDDELSDVFFRQLDLPSPDHQLGVGSGSHAVQTSNMLVGVDELIERESPDVVLVYGDTNSTLAAALSAGKRDVALAHVEAGLRSGNPRMPEEVNRILTDHVSDLLFAPSRHAVRNLRMEGITRDVVRSGDVMLDALEKVRPRVNARSRVLPSLGLTDGDYILATVHRAENTDDHARLSAIVDGLAEAPLPVVLPLHPRTKHSLEAAGRWKQATARLTVIDPVSYVDFLRLVAGAERVATDSGGVQKEAFYLDTPCVTLREETEWIETVRAGWNVLVGARAHQIEWAMQHRFDPEDKPSPYGDGDAAARIVDALTSLARTGTPHPRT